MGLDPLPELNDAYEKLVVSGSRPSALLTVALCHACLDSILAYHNQPPPHTDDDESKRLPPPPRSLTEVLRLAQGVLPEHLSTCLAAELETTTTTMTTTTRWNRMSCTLNRRAAPWRTIQPWLRLRRS